MNIVCATDDNFVQHCCIMLVSLLSHNKDVDIYIMTEGLTAEHTRILKEEVDAKGGRVHFCLVQSKLIEDLPLSKQKGLAHISRATYFRLLIADILPIGINRVLYLDCDIVVNDSIKDLWEIDMTGKAIAAVRQIGSGHEAERLGYPIQYGYFNAGVTLLNLDYIRENNVTRKLLSYLNTNSERILYNDQDVLNGALYDSCIHLMPQWNMTALIYTPFLEKRGDKRNGVVINTYNEEKKNAISHRNKPSILHFVSKPKPWDRNCVHPLYDLYFYYADMTINYNGLARQSKFERGFAIMKNKMLVYLSNTKQMIHKTDRTRL